MAKLTPPAWAPDAVPTPRGWARGKEIIAARKIPQRDIDEYFGTQVDVNEGKAVLHEAPVNKPLDELTQEQKDALDETTGSRGSFLREIFNPSE